MRIVMLCGGVGGSKLALGVSREYPHEDLTVIVNTGDDLDLYGLHVSPDLDTVMYTLGGVSDPITGWGVKDDSFRCLSMMEKYGRESWFRLGDMDMATHLLRAQLLASGSTLTTATAVLAQQLNVRATILPMTDAVVKTRIQTRDGWLGFQEYFVLRHHTDVPLSVEHEGIQQACITDEIRQVLSQADVIVAAPSNPIVSIGPILAVPGMATAIRDAAAPTVGVSPIIGGRSVSGPADALMEACGYQPTVQGLACLYKPWLQTLVIDSKDSVEEGAVAALGIKVCITDTIMTDLEARRRLARFVLQAV